MPSSTNRPARLCIATITAACLVSGMSAVAMPPAVTAAPAPPAAVATAPAFHSASPTRVVDTRDGTGTTAAPLAPAEARTLSLTGVGAIPVSGVSAVIANLTVTATSAASHLTAWPAGEPRPDVSNLNWPAGDTRANLAVIPLSPSGQASIYNNAGSAHLIIDVVGWFGGADEDHPGVHPVTPQRLVDTRDGTGTSAGPLGAAETRTIVLAGQGDVPPTDVTAVIVNLTAADTTATSHLTTWPADQPKPDASNLNWPAGDTRANLAVVPLSPSGELSLFNNSGTAQVIIDVVGWVDAPLATASLLPVPGLATASPQRLVDTRDGTGTDAAPLTSGDIRTVDFTGPGALGGDDITAVIANVTVTGTTATSHLTAWAGDRPKPAASTVNWPGGDTRANLAVIPLAPDGTANLFNNSGAAHLIIDVVGWFTGPALDIRLEGVGMLAGDATVRVVPRGFTPASVELVLDDPGGIALATITSAPFTFTIDTTTIGNGTHVLHARATAPSRAVLATQPVTVDNQAINWANVTAGMQQKVTNIPLTGNALQVALHGDVVYEQGFGTYDSHTQVFIASATKWLSGAVIMRLVDRGVLRLDTKVSAVLPEFTGTKSGVTLRQLLAFTSGLEPDPTCTGAGGYTLATCAAEIAALPSKAPPGVQYRYGSGHLTVAARMAEVAAATPWATLWQQELVTPLGLTSTVLTNATNPNPAGGAISDLADYTRFLRMVWNYGELDGERILSPAAVEQMQRDQTRGASMVGVPGAQRNAGSRYGLAEWFTVLDPATGAYEVSSPGAFGFHPWVDRLRDTYGVYVVMLISPDETPAGGWDIAGRARAAIDA